MLVYVVFVCRVSCSKACQQFIVLLKSILNSDPLVFTFQELEFQEHPTILSVQQSFAIVLDVVPGFGVGLLYVNIVTVS